MKSLIHSLEIYSVAQKRFENAGCPKGKYWSFINQVKDEFKMRPDSFKGTKVLDHYTLGWNPNGELVRVIVYASYIKDRYVVDNFDETTQLNNVVLFLADNHLFKLDSNGYGSFGSWQIIKNVIYAKDNFGIGLAKNTIDRVLANINK